MTSMFGHNIRSDLVILYIAEAFAVFLAVYGLTAWGIAQGAPVDHGKASLVAGALALCSGLVSGASGLYQPEVLSRSRRLASGALVAALLLLLAAWLSLQIFAPPPGGASIWSSVAGVVLGCVAGVAGTRLAFIVASRRGLLKRRLLIIRDPRAPLAAEREAGIEEARLSPFEIAITSSGSATLDDELHPARLRARHIWAVVAADPLAITSEMRRHCQAAGVRVLTEAEFHEARINRVACDTLPLDWLGTARGANEGPVEAGLRRGFDILVGLTLVLLALPVMLVAAAIIKIDSPGPIFYRQERSGLRGRVFTLYKFRSMIVNAEQGGMARWATKSDPRVTRFGRMMRLTRIDELPQILNVLRGDMAIVGPRPERPSFVEQLGLVIPHYNDRACVKPGITGWAQVNYPYGASVEDARMKLAYDLYYVRRRSLFLDLLILVATVRVVLFQEGAR
ncbi:exopolysaccharide biosynthesis polyprenyl glycosylphosphotransferase [Humitalea rosea]|uniref:Exopolysaccharide biosynthesis polyprenyl glycosylphosphotransferase n=1 Tax=Humitalea rosea TaxID=990373 RepID=A0A2W7IJB4_9PROT|nr:exopolysaccharide biosynthesis polyprenyl glycosylphosphotransferase [Humitalea rosea]PZW46788.1 exopolysaccharide biosynthesis polyprenyl glycosylphosphotransferase [Humitalea rosea]